MSGLDPIVDMPELKGKAVCRVCSRGLHLELYCRWFTPQPCAVCGATSEERTNGYAHPPKRTNPEAS